MKERSGMPYDVVAYEADDLAMQLNEAEEGLFHRMLRRSWMNGSIPADMNALASICRTHPAKLKKAWIRVAVLWKPHPSLEGRLINSKQERERAYREEKTQSARESAEKRWKEQKTRINNDAVAMQTQCEGNAPLPSPSLPLLKDPSSPLHSPTPKQPAAYTDEFEMFWTAYPKKIGKGDAFTAWKKNGHPPVAKLVTVLDGAKRSPKWREQNGRFIPNPATWLNQKRWDDDYGSQSVERKVVY